MAHGNTGLQHILALVTGPIIYCIELKRLLSQGNFFIKQNPGEASLTIDKLQTMLTSGTYSQIMSKLMHDAKNISGTNAYWNQVKQELKSNYKSSWLSNNFLDFVLC